MKKRIVIGLIILSLIVIAYNQLPSPKKVIVCNDPYMRHGSGCCLDANDNSICDADDGSLVSESDIIKAVKESKGSCPNVVNIDLVKGVNRVLPSWYRQVLITYNDADNDIVSLTRIITYPDGQVDKSTNTNIVSQEVSGLFYEMALAGTVKVSVYVTDASGCDSNTLTKTFTVEGKPQTTSTLTKDKTKGTIVPSSDSSTSSSSGSVALFSDDFSGSFPGGNWVVSRSGSEIDIVGGKLALHKVTSYPGLQISPDAAFLNDGSLEFNFRLALPDTLPQEEFCVEGDEIGSIALVNIVNTNSGVTWAKLYIVRGHCGRNINSNTGNLITYKIGTGNLVPYSERPLWETNDAGFNEYTFRINPDGTTEWRKNGNLKVRNTMKKFPYEGFTIQFSGEGDGQTPVYLDDVVIR